MLLKKKIEDDKNSLRIYSVLLDEEKTDIKNLANNIKGARKKIKKFKSKTKIFKEKIKKELSKAKKAKYRSLP